MFKEKNIGTSHIYRMNYPTNLAYTPAAKTLNMNFFLRGDLKNLEFPASERFELCESFSGEISAPFGSFQK